MLDRTDHRRRLDRLRKAEEYQRKRDATKTHDQLRHYPYWMLDTEAGEIIADARRIKEPTKEAAEGLKKLGRPIPNREYRTIVGRLARAHYKHLKATLENLSSRVRLPSGF